MLEVKNLVKIYKTKGGVAVHALDDVSLSFPETGMIFLLGKSGSGKSTLLNVIGGLDKPDSGEIIIKGKNSKTFSGGDFDSYRNTYIGFIFQEYNILEEFNIEQNISLALQLQGKPNDKKAVDAMLAQVDLVGFGKRKPNTLSGGQKQRVAIARALIKDPEIIMADEPTGALDSNTGKQVFDTLKKLSKDKLVIIVSHDRDFAEHYADRIIELSDGKVISDVSKESVTPVILNTNINIVNNDTVTIADTSILTEADMVKILDVLKGHEGQAIITANQSNIPNIKHTLHMAEDGSSEVFNDTKEVELLEYDGKKTKFIRSHLPFSRAFKMGASSLKVKPIRLAFTMLLTVIALVMFGLASTLMLFDPAYSVSEALKKSDYVTEAVRKEFDVTRHNYQVDNNTGKKEETYSYTDQKGTYFSATEVEKYNKEGLNFAGIINFSIPSAWSGYSRGFSLEGINGNKLSTYYRCFSALSGFIDVDKSYLDNNGLEIVAGSFVSNVDEILLPDYVATQLVESRDDVGSFSDLVGKTCTINISTNVAYENVSFEISGVFNSGSIPSKFDALKLDDGSLSSKEEDELRTSLTYLLFNSFHTLGVVHKDFFDQNKDRFMEKNSTYGELYNYTTYVHGFRLSDFPYAGNPSVDSEEGSDYLVESDLAYVSNAMKFYDTEGKETSYKNLEREEIYLSKHEYANSYREYIDIMLSNEYRGMFYNRSYTQSLFSLTESETQQYIDQIDLIYNNDFYTGSFRELSTQSTAILDNLDTSFYKEYATRKYQLEMANTMVSYGASEGGYSKEDFEQFRYKVMGITETSPYNYSNMSSVESFLTSDPYHYLEHGLIIKIFDNVRGAKDARPDLNELREKYASSSYLTEEEWNALKTYLLDYGYNESSFKYNHDYKAKTYKDFSYSKKFYFYTSKGQSGVLTVKGFYEYAEHGYYTVLSDSFVSNYGHKDDYSNRVINETKYVEPSDIKYSYIISKTSFSQSQVSEMLKDYGSYRLKMTDYTYTSLMSVLYLVEILTTVFLSIGISSGVFAALLLFNFISTSIASKTKEIGILRAVGARGSDLFKIFFSESGLVSIICVIIAIGISLFSSIQLNDSMSSDIGISMLHFGIINIGIMVAGAIVIAILGTFLPVLFASRKPPVESIRTL